MLHRQPARHPQQQPHLQCFQPLRRRWRLQVRHLLLRLLPRQPLLLRQRSLPWRMHGTVQQTSYHTPLQHVMPPCCLTLKHIPDPCLAATKTQL